MKGIFPKPLPDYDKESIQFLNITGTTIEKTFVKHDAYFLQDAVRRKKRDIYSITIRKGLRSYSFLFGQSIEDTGKRPTTYDILCCLVKEHPGSFKGFCERSGLDHKSFEVFELYEKYCLQFNNLASMYKGVEMELLRGIKPYEKQV